MQRRVCKIYTPMLTRQNYAVKVITDFAAGVETGGVGQIRAAFSTFHFRMR
jgi:hypothetical protein